MKPKIGDIIEIPLRSGKYGYAQYVHWDKNNGPLIQVFDLVSANHVALEELASAEPMFPPVITGLYAAVRSGLWRIIGNAPVTGFGYPSFVSTEYDETTGRAGVWFLWGGTDWERIGKTLPMKYQDLEFLVVWSPVDVAERIESKKEPFPYSDLKRKNWFDPKKNR